eukprot:TRINITY_DN4524_c0_g1_i1.p3 TRINITY_DN4524_c0_g1~~TRINITY_DN4524_c0_g1_i1.p3  ORF type:complete len:153 (-),score=19.45 TRINITY_DN4524_c0_g1_i1:70-528(-)
MDPAHVFYGDSYSGEWQEGREHGKGIYSTVFGTKYKGEYCEGRRTGRGTFIHPDGHENTCMWKEDIPDDVISLAHPDIRDRIVRGKCTKDLTKKPFYGQVIVECITCFQDEEMAHKYVCLQCANKCHAGHHWGDRRWTTGRTGCSCSSSICP